MDEKLLELLVESRFGRQSFRLTRNQTRTKKTHVFSARLYLIELESTGHQLAADVRPRSDGALRSVLVELELEPQRVEQRVIETEIVNTLAVLLGEAKVSFAVRCGRTPHRNPLVGAICHCHVWDGRA